MHTRYIVRTCTCTREGVEEGVRCKVGMVRAQKWNWFMISDTVVLNSFVNCTAVHLAQGAERGVTGMSWIGHHAETKEGGRVEGREGGREGER